MAGIASTSVASTVSIAESSTQGIIFNVICPLANIEYQQILPTNTKGFVLKSRLDGELKIAYFSGDSGLLYFTVPSGTAYFDENFYTTQVLYFQSNIFNDIIEIIAYKKY